MYLCVHVHGCVCVCPHPGQTPWTCLMKSQAGQIRLGDLVQPLWPLQILLLQPLQDSLQRELSYLVVRALQETLQELAHTLRASPQLRASHAGVQSHPGQAEQVIGAARSQGNGGGLVALDELRGHKNGKSISTEGTDFWTCQTWALC